MSDMAIEQRVAGKTPWHVWVVGVLALLWNGSGAYTIILAQQGKWPGISADEAAYYAAQPAWFVAVTDLALLSAIAGAAALLLRSRWAVALFGLSLAAIAVTAGYDLAAGTSRVYANRGAAFVSVLIWILAALQLLYAVAMKTRGVLR